VGITTTRFLEDKQSENEKEVKERAKPWVADEKGASVS